MTRREALISSEYALWLERSESDPEMTISQIMTKNKIRRSTMTISVGSWYKLLTIFTGLESIRYRYRPVIQSVISWPPLLGPSHIGISLIFQNSRPARAIWKNLSRKCGESDKLRKFVRISWSNT